METGRETVRGRGRRVQGGVHSRLLHSWPLHHLGPCWSSRLARIKSGLKVNHDEPQAEGSSEAQPGQGETQVETHGEEEEASRYAQQTQEEEVLGLKGATRILTQDGTDREPLRLLV